MMKLNFLHGAKKRFGQHFIVESSIIETLVKFIMPQAEDIMIEIGPGLGALTFAILPYVNHLQAIELDRDLAMHLTLSKDPKLTIHQLDALRYDFKKGVDKNKKIRVIGNLPYNISTPLLFHLLSFSEYIQDMHFMLQKEVAERLVGKCSTKAYGRLSVMVGYVSQVALLSLIPPTAFHPSPKVTSAFVRIVPYTTLPFVASDFSLFSKIVQQAFNQRRKTLKNSLHAIVTPAHFEKAEIDSQLRAENLDVEGFVKLTNICSQDSF